ncbi:MAG: TRAP transporter small permease [Firmicutes bacterium]|nr:TRAP transporter small permease [Bacillota bacterium]
MRSFVRTLEKIQTVFVGFLLAVLLVVVSLQVWTRFVSYKPLMWTEEVARFSLVWIVFQGAAIAVQRKAHYILDILPARLSQKTRRILSLLCCLFMFAMAYVIVYHGWVFAVSGLRRLSPTVELPMFWVYLAIPTSGICMMIYIIGHVLELLSVGIPVQQREDV